MFSRSELEAFRKTQEDHMMDTCMIYRTIGKVKTTRGDYVDAIDDEGTESICGVMMQPIAMQSHDKALMADIDVVLRLPLSVKVEPKDEIEITKRFGEDVPVRRYIVDRYTNDGPSGCRAYLKAKVLQ